MSPTIRWITRTAILLALTVLFQSLRVLIPVMPADVSQYVVGSLVNLCLILAAVTVGIKGGMVIAVVAPVIAFIQDSLPYRFWLFLLHLATWFGSNYSTFI